ncbi:hypothetical protein PG913_06815 [Tenacibaculum pacificus]|uniref:hypothetical protein n=1 Tax=Tenacibaculum TaxID=104267 RepID=UPI0022F37F1B|nr:hypothetical protein [Tenacibaculum pacificus]WBX72629.1 hypothetical protein PG913_06815 [Tenacibaculum pacificus]
MALQITQKNGTFYLKGKLNNSTSKFFIIFFDFNIKKNKQVTINIDNLDEITKDGLNAINILTRKSKKTAKNFSIIGLGCKEIYDHFDEINVA